MHSDSSKLQILYNLMPVPASKLSSQSLRHIALNLLSEVL